MRYLVAKFFDKKLLYGMSVLLCIIESVGEIIIPYLMGSIVNQGIMQSNTDMVKQYGIIMIVVTLIMGLCGYLYFVLSRISGLSFTFNIRNKLYEKLLCKQNSSIKSGSAITRLTIDADRMTQVGDVLAEMCIKPVILAIGGFLMIYNTSSVFGAVFAGFILIQIVLVIAFMGKTSPIFLKIQSIFDNVNHMMQETLHHIRLIKSFSSENNESSEFDKENNRLFNTDMRVLRIMSAFNPIIMFLMNIVIILIVFFLGYKSKSNDTAVGNMMMSITYAEQILMSLMMTSNLARIVAELKPSVSRINEVILAPDDQTGNRGLSGINEFLYEQGSVSLSIKPGDIVSVFGATASGKTYLAKYFSGDNDPETYDSAIYDKIGSLKINGYDISEYNIEDIQKHIAIVSKDNTAVFSGSLLYNVNFDRDNTSRESAEKALKATELSDLVDSLPYGIDSHLYSSGNTISGGQKLRVMIARALAVEPDVLILDDATASIDYKTESAIFNNIGRLYPHTSVIFFTQRKKSAQSISRTFELKKGRLAEYGV